MADIIFPGVPPLGTLGDDKLPANMDLSIWQGDAQTYIINLTAEDGSAIDLTNYTARGTIRASFTDPTKYSFVCTHTDTNQITLYLSSTLCASIPAGSYVWEFQLQAPSGDVRTYLAGDVTVLAEVDS